MIKLYNDDCLNVLKQMESKSIDLIIADPPYLIHNTRPGGKSELSRSIEGMNNEIRENNLVNGFDVRILAELERVSIVPNMYFWCNKSQIPMYFDYFVNERNYSFDILCWFKTNAMPLFSNKYLSDKEYCLYFKKGGYCRPQTYEDAKTIFQYQINAKDKKIYKHPTIKPLHIIETLVRNSSLPGQVVLDPFMGSGTTGVAAVMQDRDFIGIEIKKDFYETAEKRIEESVSRIKTLSVI